MDKIESKRIGGHYRFHRGPLSPEMSPDFEPAIFNTPEYFAPQDTTGWLSFYILNERTSTASASLHFHRQGSLARSPLKAPFGSVDCGENINPALLFDFLNFVEEELRRAGVEGVYLKNPPRAYSPSRLSLLETFLLNQKYIVAEAESGAVISVSETPFADVICHSERLRLQQARSAGLAIRRLPDEQITQVYAFIARCHAEKGYRISITAQELEATVRRFPGRYLLFGIFDGERMISAGVSIRIKAGILYNFLLNHDREYNGVSPPLLLLEGVYDYCRGNSIRILDLGTSAIEGKPNFSLLDFKLHLGGIPTTKFSFYKKLV